MSSASIRFNYIYWRIGTKTTHEPRSLIVEHDDRVCRVLCRIVKRMGYESFPAADYDHFKALYNEAIPDIILLNLEIAGNDNTRILPLPGRTKITGNHLPVE